MFREASITARLTCGDSHAGAHDRSPSASPHRCRTRATTPSDSTTATPDSDDGCEIGCSTGHFALSGTRSSSDIGRWAHLATVYANVGRLLPLRVEVAYRLFESRWSSTARSYGLDPCANPRGVYSAPVGDEEEFATNCYGCLPVGACALLQAKALAGR